MAAVVPRTGLFKHDALLYAGRDEFVDRMGAFCRDAVDAEERILVMVTQDKIDDLRSSLGSYADRVQFRDMARIGRNPSRIIPAWREFFAAAGKDGADVRGIGEPIWSTRTPQELRESERHEALINLAFTDAEGWLLCPYDTTTLDRAVISHAHETHPVFYDGRQRERSRTYLGENEISKPFDELLPEPSAPVYQIAFDFAPLDSVRHFVEQWGHRFGLSERRCADLLVAANEAAANSIRHGGGSGLVRIWKEDGCVVCEVTDSGRITHPLAGRVRPLPGAEGGFGLWLVNQMCDLVQIRSSGTGTTVRMRVSV